MRLMYGLLGVLAFESASAARADSVLTKIYSKFLQPVQESVHVVRLSDGATLFAQDPDLELTPASVSKLVTAAAVLDALTPAFRFQTKVYHTGRRQGGVINGDLVVVGDGDPFLVSEKMWQMAVDLRNLGISAIKGDLIIDDRLFDDEARDKSRLAGAVSSSRAYDAPVSAFGVNFNTFAVMVVPGPAVGSPARTVLDPYHLSGIRIQSDAKTTNGSGRDGIRVSRVLDGKSGQEVIHVAGSIGVSAEPTKIYRSVGDYRSAAGEYLRAFLEAQAISIAGSTRLGALPAERQLLYTLDGYPMQKVIEGLNKYSNNYIADVLVKRVGAKFPSNGQITDAPGAGTYQNGIAVIEKFMRNRVGIKTPFTIRNGSGLSTENRLTARQMTQLLSYMETRMDLFPEFLASLPAAGWDGTLRDRLTSEQKKLEGGKVRAKTGTLTEPVSVASLAGYVRHPRHGWIAFAMIENGKSKLKQPNVGDLRARQDQALSRILDLP